MLHHPPSQNLLLKIQVFIKLLLIYYGQHLQPKFFKIAVDDCDLPAQMYKSRTAISLSVQLVC